MFGNVPKINLEIAINAPVLPEDTTPKALPSFTATIAAFILESLRCLSAKDGLSFARTLSEQ